MNIAVVGGGIAGLSAAWELATRWDADVTLFEPGRLGGKIETEDFCGHPVDTGPDAFIARVPDAIRLCQELGIESELIAPATSKALVWRAGRLHSLPEGTILGAPSRLGPLVRSGLLSPFGVLRAGLDLVLPASQYQADTDVADLIRRRFGRQVADRLVDTLLGSIHAGNTHRLSVEATAPQLAQAARSHRSLLMGLRKSAPAGTGPLFVAPRAGMGRLVERLVEALDGVGVKFVREPVSAMRRGKGSEVAVEPAGLFDRAVVATPASVASRLLMDGSREASEGLARIRTASVVVTTLAYPTDALRVPDGASGFLVAPDERWLMTACSFGSAKWPHWSEPGRVVLRVSAGRDGDPRALELSDDALVERLHTEVARAVEATGSPVAHRVSRWPDAFPQFEVGHLAAVGRIEQALARDLPGVRLAGASYRGSGIPACVASGRRAAAVAAPS